MTREEQFSIFWGCYPRKVAKGTARKSFEKAIKKTTLESMLDAITRYVANKPQWCDYKHPSTWLQAESWDDEWEPTQAKAPKPEEREITIRRHQLSDEYRSARDEGRREDAARIRKQLDSLA